MTAKDFDAIARVGFAQANPHFACLAVGHMERAQEQEIADLISARFVQRLHGFGNQFEIARARQDRRAVFGAVLIQHPTAIRRQIGRELEFTIRQNARTRQDRCRHSTGFRRSRNVGPKAINRHAYIRPDTPIHRSDLGFVARPRLRIGV